MKESFQLELSKAKLYIYIYIDYEQSLIISNYQVYHPYRACACMPLPIPRLLHSLVYLARCMYLPSLLHVPT